MNDGSAIHYSELDNRSVLLFPHKDIEYWRSENSMFSSFQNIFFKKDKAIGQI